MAPGNADERAEDAFWDALGARVFHPVRVEIIEALRWIDEALSAKDLTRIFAERRAGLRAEHHLRRLAKLGVVTLDRDPKKTAPQRQPSYRLAERPTP